MRLLTLIVSALALFTFGCEEPQQDLKPVDETPPVTPQEEPEEQDPATPEGPSLEDVPRAPQSDVLTEEEQAALQPDEVLKLLQEGNERFASGDLTLRDHSAAVRATAGGQFPKAAILSCVDSRVPVEDVFDRGIGDVFVARVAGNFENTDILGSMEFATKVAGSKLIMVLGHESCGAIKGAIDDVKLGNLTATLAHIKPAIEAISDYDGARTSKNEEFVHLVAEENVRLTIDGIMEKSEVLREMVDQGELKIVGAMYDLNTAKVTLVAPRTEENKEGDQ